MAEQEDERKTSRVSGRVRKCLWRTAVVLIIALMALGLFWIGGQWQFYRAGKKLAAIEAELAIPHAENAAVIYDELLASYDPDSLTVSFLNSQADTLTMREPWASEDYPELAEWLKDHEVTLLKLLEACKKEKCRFPIGIEAQEMRGRMPRLAAMRRWTFLSARAANNDLGDGRIEAGLEKYLCLTQMAKHLYQQPVMADFLVGTAIEALAFNRMRRFMVEGDATEVHLNMVEAAIASTENNWSEDSSMVLEVEPLLEKRRSKFGLFTETRPGLIERLRLWWRNIREPDPSETMHRVYILRLRARRASRILVALRRCKNETGQWPESLDEIRLSLPNEILVDPSNNGSFVYMLTDDGFKFYSKGENNIDEDGKYGDGADDRLVWPPRRWKTAQKGTNTE